MRITKRVVVAAGGLVLAAAAMAGCAEVPENQVSTPDKSHLGMWVQEVDLSKYGYDHPIICIISENERFSCDWNSK